MQNIDPIRQTHKRNVLTPDRPIAAYIVNFSYFSRRAKTNVGGYLRLPACARIYVYIHNGSSVTYACNPSIDIINIDQT